MLEVVPTVNGEDMADQAAGLVVSAAAAAVRARGRFLFCLSGGRTPRRLYESLAKWSGPETMPWDRTEFFWGDERAVAQDDPDSNFGLAYETLLSKIALDPRQVHAMPGTAKPLDQGARDYEQTLRRFFPGPPGPTFDLILLGVGPDGHTASLFPGRPAVEEAESMVLAVEAPAGVSPARPRLTLTLPVINGAGTALFLAAGADKQRVVREITSGQAPERYPAGRVMARQRTIWLVAEELLSPE